MKCFSRLMIFFFKQKTAYEMRISDWSSDVCSSDLAQLIDAFGGENGEWFSASAAKTIGEGLPVRGRNDGTRIDNAVKAGQEILILHPLVQATFSSCRISGVPDAPLRPLAAPRTSRTSVTSTCDAPPDRSEARRAGKEGGRPGGSRWSPT